MPAMRWLTANPSRLRKKITTSGLTLVASLPPPAAACQGWNTDKFFATATVDPCLSTGEDPNKPDTQGLTALHWAARKTSDPAVIEALLDAGASASSIAGRTLGITRGRTARSKARLPINGSG